VIVNWAELKSSTVNFYRKIQISLFLVLLSESACEAISRKITEKSKSQSIERCFVTQRDAEKRKASLC
jgi:hypothetical protein